MENGKRRRERLVTGLLLAAILFLFAFFLRDSLLPFLRLELRNDLEGANEYLRTEGLAGFVSVVLVEALQMVVVFIPAEFIQISSGLNYPFWLALLLCDLGVCLGATVIFLLVRTLHVHSAAYEKRRSRIDRLSAPVRDRGTILILYLLFFMPLIPFGAICYYGSSTRLRYGRYLLTVATGVVPSIVISNLMGEAGMAFLRHALPFWPLLLIIVLLAALLFGLILFFLDRFCFRHSDGTPDSPACLLIFALARLWRGSTRKLLLEDSLLAEAEAPYILLANHESFFDFYYIHQLAHPKNPNYFVNEYYTTRPVLKYLGKKMGVLSKKLFTPDVASAMGLLRMLKKGYPVVIFPEGRLSPDGSSNPILEEGGALYKRLGVDLVLARISGAYYAKPKWRRRIYRTPIRVTVARVLKKEELAALSPEEVDRIIADTLYTDAGDGGLGPYPQRDKAAGLENVLYRCPLCGTLYSTRGQGNELRCTACGKSLPLDENYRFPPEVGSISDAYRRIRALERKELEGLHLQAKVKTKIHGAKGGRTRQERGECTLTEAGFAYRSGSVEFFIPTEKLLALPFSCGEEFECYHGDELYYFYPEENRQQVARWALLADLMTERHREQQTVRGTK